MLAVLESEELVRHLTPDLLAVTRLPAGGLIGTAKSHAEGVVSRYFAPVFGRPEDLVTGSAPCTIGPYPTSGGMGALSSRSGSRPNRHDRTQGSQVARTLGQRSIQ